ncbi:hypothetical protein V8C37DRAFT_364599, partial [Trichoderma ceciliae]
MVQFYIPHIYLTKVGNFLLAALGRGIRSGRLYYCSTTQISCHKLPNQVRLTHISHATSLSSPNARSFRHPILKQDHIGVMLGIAHCLLLNRLVSLWLVRITMVCLPLAFPLCFVLLLSLDPLVKTNPTLVPALSAGHGLDNICQLHHQVQKTPKRTRPRRRGILAIFLFLPFTSRSGVGDRGLLPRLVAPHAIPVHYSIHSQSAVLFVRTWAENMTPEEGAHILRGTVFT